jgi:hypothetical protein
MISKENIEWLISNYNKIGLAKSAKILNTSKSTIYKYCKKHNLKFTYKDLVIEDLNSLLSKKEFIYFLGFFWADGTIRNKTNTIKIELKREDAREIKNTFLAVFPTLKYYEYDRSSIFKLSSKKIWDFLEKYDYYIKSGASANKILSLIPENLLHYWWRGFIDGDGCISPKQGGTITFCGCYLQNWNFTKEILNKLNIQNSEHKYITLNGNRSDVTINGYENTIKFCNYIYQNYEKDKIGLKRKYNKYQELIKNCKKFIDYKNGVQIYTTKTKEKKFRIETVDNLINIPVNYYSKLEDAILNKFLIIKNYNTLEFRLRKMINYWEYKPKNNLIPYFRWQRVLFNLENSITNCFA